MLLHGIETRDSACSSFICFCFVGWIQNLAVCYGVQHYIASRVCVCVCVCVQVVVLRASPPVFLVYDPAKIFLTSKFSYLLFCNPTHQTETGTSNRWELLTTNNLDQSLCLANHTQGAAVRSYLSHSSLAGGEFCCAFLPG